MDASAVIDLLGSILEKPIATLLIGLGIGYFFDLRREDSRRKEDRRLRRVEAQQSIVGDLQLALAEALHGVHNANIASTRAMARLMERRMRPEAGNLSEAFPEMLDTQWRQDWLAAIRRVAILTTRVGDPELKALSESCIQLMGEMHPEAEEGFEERFGQLQWAVHEANERAGKLYQEIITDEPIPWYKRRPRSSSPALAPPATPAPVPPPEPLAGTPPPPPAP